MAIPIANLYYLLAYAWDHSLSEAELVPIDAELCPDLNNFFATVLDSAAHRLVRRGLDQTYIGFGEETARIRGRIDISASEKQLSRTRGRLICIYDDLSPDVLHNQILKATIRLLRNDQQVNKESRKRLAKTLDVFRDVSDLQVTPHHFHRVQLHRNNRAYRFIIHLCELIHDSLLPDRAEAGTRRFRDFTRDEKVMPKVFENFIRNFAIRHLAALKISPMHIKWHATNFGETTEGYLPGMITDVTVEWSDRKLILDCKYYQQAMTTHYDALRFDSGNLYQLHAYLTNKAVEPGWEDVEGMLLYPSNGYSFDHTFTLHGHHRIRIATVDLQQPWTSIESELLELFGRNQPAARMINN
ncbi:MAG: hypothetical protein NTV93_20940 [Verrucomicrobia bacterium]|nr:hypothetical protein [Verrucomicrobiota bacterium]